MARTTVVCVSRAGRAPGAKTVKTNMGYSNFFLNEFRPVLSG